MANSTSVNQIACLIAAGEFYGAAAKIGRAYVSSGPPSSTSISQWLECFRARATDEEVYREVSAVAAAEARKVQRILGIGERWEVEEFVLVLTIQCDLEAARLAYGLLFDAEIPIDVGDMEDQILRIARTAANRSAVASSVALMRRNDPFFGRWHLADRLRALST